MNMFLHIFILSTLQFFLYPCPSFLAFLNLTAAFQNYQDFGKEDPVLKCVFWALVILSPPILCKVQLV